MARPVRIAIANDYEIVVAGLAALMADFTDRVKVVELDAGLPVQADVDVILYDTFGQSQGDAVDVDSLVNGHPTRIVIFSWNVEAELIRRSTTRGVSGYVSKSVTLAELVDAIERVAAGEVVVMSGEEQRDLGRWPGEDLGLSNRESEVLCLITEGLSNEEICQQTYLSKNTLKTYIRNLYRKIDVDRRSQAVLFGVRHGFQSDTMRATREGTTHM